MSTVNPSPSPPAVPSTPDMTPQERGQEIYTALLSIVGAVGFAVPPIFTNMAVEQQIISGGLVIVGVVWSWIGAKTKALKAHQSAMASAKASSTGLVTPLRVQ